MRAAANQSDPANLGISVTTTKTARSTTARSTRSATEVQQPAKATKATRRRGGGKRNQNVDSPESGDDLSVLASVTRDLASVPSEMATGGLAAMALALAREIDGENSATSKSMCAGQLRDTLDRIRELSPDKEEGDSLDDLAARRANRIAGSTAT